MQKLDLCKNFSVQKRLWSCKSLEIVEPVCVILLRFATHCLQVAVEWLRQGSSSVSCMRNTIVFFLPKVVTRIVIVNRIVMAA